MYAIPLNRRVLLHVMSLTSRTLPTAEKNSSKSRARILWESCIQNTVRASLSSGAKSSTPLELASPPFPATPRLASRDRLLWRRPFLSLLSLSLLSLFLSRSLSLSLSFRSLSFSRSFSRSLSLSLSRGLSSLSRERRLLLRSLDFLFSRDLLLLLKQIKIRLKLHIDYNLSHQITYRLNVTQISFQHPFFIF